MASRSSSCNGRSGGGARTASPASASAAAIEGENENGVTNNDGGGGDDEKRGERYWWRIWIFLGVLALDAAASGLLFGRIFPLIRKYEDDDDKEHRHYTFAGSLSDLGLLASLRLLLAGIALLAAYVKGEVLPEYYPFELYHPRTGEKKSREELQQEALEEPCGEWFGRYVRRPAFAAELCCLATEFVCVAKALVRMNYEIGTLADEHRYHPLFWIAMLTTAVLASVEVTFLDAACKRTGELGHERLGDRSREGGSILRTITSSLSIPLLAAEHQREEGDDGEENLAGDEEQQQERDGANEPDEDARAVSEIAADTNYKASWADLFRICAPDVHLIAIAFVFLVLAAVAQVYIPKFLGNILDSLAEAFSKDGDGDDDDSTRRHKSMFDVPGFIDNTEKLVMASILAGVFAGLRGSVFTVVGGRVNVRLRILLMDSLLSQDIGFFDTTKTGDITSRLSSDTTLVGDQVSLNVNVFLRSLVQALGVLLFMFLVSWQLSVLAFISVPLITIFSRWYGSYVQSLVRLMQKKLADGNSVSEASLGSMPTVRAFDAAELELKEFEAAMGRYLHFNFKGAWYDLVVLVVTRSIHKIIHVILRSFLSHPCSFGFLARIAVTLPCT